MDYYGGNVPREMADIWKKEAVQIVFLRGQSCGFNQHENNTGTAQEETMEGKRMQSERECSVQREAESYSMQGARRQ